MAECHGTLETHFEKPSAGARSPGGLAFHNTVLDRIPIVLSSLPSFRTTRHLMFISLYGRVLHCLTKVSKHKTLEQCFAKTKAFSELEKHVQLIYAQYADVTRVQELRDMRAPEEAVRKTEAKRVAAELAKEKKTAKEAAVEAGKDPKDIPMATKPSPLLHVKKGDMVFENALLFMRDALITREVSDAIKSADSGRIIGVLKMLAFSFRGNVRSTYAHEILHVLHNLTQVCPPALR